jgi:hypothetical protein
MLRQSVPESQENAARWRSWTYHAFERQLSSECNIEENASAWAEYFATGITDNVIKPLLELFGPNRKLDSIDSISQDLLRKVATSAYLWNHKVNTGFFQYDFHPYLPQFNEVFNPQCMKRDGVPKEKATTGNIIACVGMGLKTSIAKGMDCDLEEVWQLRARIVTQADI